MCWITNLESWFQNHWVAPNLTQPFILLWSIKWVRRTTGDLVVKSKLSPSSGSVNPIRKRGQNVLMKIILGKKGVEKN